MASNRHLGRIIALQTLYEQEFRQDAGDKTFDTSEVLNRNITRYSTLVDDVDFIRTLVDGVTMQQAELDETLQPIAPEWPIDQIARMDRIILRMGLYELQHGDKVPPKVVINEAIELAKAFGSENSSKFINGVLGTALRNQQGDKQPVQPKSTEKKAAKADKSTKTAKSAAKSTKSTKKTPKTTQEEIA